MRNECYNTGMYVRLLYMGIIIVAAVFFLATKQNRQDTITIAPSPSPSLNISSTPSSNLPPTSKYVEPTAEFTLRITKKPFGLYISPDTSPVQPERFQGYHTAVDVEFEDVPDNVPVYAIADGTVRQSRYVSGYGGLVVIEHGEGADKFYSLYGHLRLSTLPDDESVIERGKTIGVLGTGYSTETDGERKHLHFGIITSSSIDIRGYVQNTTDLNQMWRDPLSLYQ